MHDAEEVRKEASYVALDRTREMLLAYADLLEAIEDLNNAGHHYMVAPIAVIRLRADEKQKARKG